MGGGLPPPYPPPPGPPRRKSRTGIVYSDSIRILGPNFGAHGPNPAAGGLVNFGPLVAPVRFKRIGSQFWGKESSAPLRERAEGPVHGDPYYIERTLHTGLSRDLIGSILKRHGSSCQIPKRTAIHVSLTGASWLRVDTIGA